MHCNIVHDIYNFNGATVCAAKRHTRSTISHTVQDSARIGARRGEFLTVHAPSRGGARRRLMAS